MSDSSSTNKFVVSIDGLIGAGKSTVISKLKETHAYDFCCIPEPLIEWSLLERFYEDKKKYATPLQFQIILSQHDQFVKCYNETKAPVLITERSTSASVFVFSEMLLRMGYFEKHWWDIYKNLSTKFVNNINFYVYLDISPQCSLDRIKQRGRHFEKDIDLEYLQSLYTQYENFYKNLPTDKYTKINASEPIENVIENVLDSIVHASQL